MIIKVRLNVTDVAANGDGSGGDFGNNGAGGEGREGGVG